MRLFHGTSTTRLEAILENGLVPQASHDNPKRTAIYLTDDISMAESYADLSCKRRGGSPTIIEIDYHCLNEAFLEPDDFELQNMITDLEFSEGPNEIGVLSGLEIDERLLGYQNWYEVSPDVSLEITRQVCYTDVLPASSFINLARLHDQLGAMENQREKDDEYTSTLYGAPTP